MRLSAAGPAPGPPGRLYPLSPVHRPGGCELNLGQVRDGGLEVVRLPDSIEIQSLSPSKSFSCIYVVVYYYFLCCHLILQNSETHVAWTGDMLL